MSSASSSATPYIVLWTQCSQHFTASWLKGSALLRFLEPLTSHSCAPVGSCSAHVLKVRNMKDLAGMSCPDATLMCTSVFRAGLIHVDQNSCDLAALNEKVLLNTEPTGLLR